MEYPLSGIPYMEGVDCLCWYIQAMIGLEIMTNGDLRSYLNGIDLR